MVQAAITNLIDPPPRLTGDAGQDTVAVIQWLNAFYVKGVLSGGLLQPQNMAPALISLGALPGATDMLAYYVSEDTFDLTGFTAWARTLLEAVDAAAGRVVLGLGALAVNDTIDLATEVTGNLAVAHLNSGTGAAAGKYWQGDGTWATPPGAGDVVGPAVATGNNVALFDGATGKIIKDGGALGSGAYAAAYTLPTATSVVLGGVKPDGTSITNTSGAISVTYPLTAAPGTAAYQNVGAFDPSGAAAAVTPATLGLVIGINVQAYDADLVTWAGVTPGTGVATALAVNVDTAGAVLVNGGALGSPSSAGTLPAHTLGGTVSGGGNQVNNVIIGTSTPLAGYFTTLNSTGIAHLAQVESKTQTINPVTSGANNDFTTINFEDRSMYFVAVEGHYSGGSDAMRGYIVVRQSGAAGSGTITSLASEFSAAFSNIVATLTNNGADTILRVVPTCSAGSEVIVTALRLS